MPDGIYDPPVSCGLDGCRSRSFMPAKHLATCIDWQRIAIQGLTKDEKNAGNTGGGVPRPLDVELVGDLTNICGPGDVVSITGVLRVESEIAAGNGGGRKRKAGGGGGGDNCISLHYLKAISVRGLGRDALSGPAAAAITFKQQGIGTICHSMADHHHTTTVGGGGGNNNNNSNGELNFVPPNVPGFAKLDLQFIKMSTDTCKGDQLRQLVLSLCPRVHGQELVKAGLILALFGGVRKQPTTPLATRSAIASVILSHIFTATPASFNTTKLFPPASLVASAIEQAANIAAYCSPSGASLVAATTVVYAMAPVACNLSRVRSN
jgi:DNA helicase MCM8